MSNKIRTSQLEVPTVAEMDRLLGGCNLSVEGLSGAVNGHEEVNLTTDNGTLVLNIEPGRYYRVQDAVVDAVEVASVVSSLRESLVRFTTTNRQVPIRFFEGCRVCGDAPSGSTLEASREYLLRVIDGIVCFFELRAAAVASIRPYECTYRGQNGEYVKLYGGSVGDISAMTVDGVSVEPTLYRAFGDNKEHIVKFTFADPRHLPEGAFAGCTGLRAITVPEGVCELPPSFCYGCSAIYYESRTIYRPVYREYATEFCRVSALGPCPFYSVNLPKTLKSIGAHAFDGALKCYTPLYLQLPAGCLYIGDYAFNGCDLSELAMSDSALLRMIGDSAFAGCSIENFWMPFYLESVGNFAFYNNPISVVGISRRLRRLGRYAYQGNRLSGANSLLFPSTLRFNANYSGEGAFSTSDLVASGQGFEVYWFCRDAIPAGFFNGASNLKTLHSVASDLGSNAFRGCTGLLSVSLEEGCRYIGNQAFKGCSSLNFLVMPMSLIEIGEMAFSGCSSLQEVTHVYGLSAELRNHNEEDVVEVTWPTLPAEDPALMAIGEKAFEDCASLLDMLSESRYLQYIGENAFLHHAEGFRFYSATPYNEVDDRAGGSYDATIGNYQYLLFLWNIQQ